MKIEVGDYIRIKKGIAKIKKIDSSDLVAWIDEKDIFVAIDRESGNIYYEIMEDNVKHSKNIIDLIEPGDYVNGYLCRYITDINTGEEHICNFDLNLMEWTPLKNIDIWDNILTHEQYENNCYRVEE